MGLMVRWFGRESSKGWLMFGDDGVMARKWWGLCGLKRGDAEARKKLFCSVAMRRSRSGSGRGKFGKWLLDM